MVLGFTRHMKLQSNAPNCPFTCDVPECSRSFRKFANFIYTEIIRDVSLTGVKKLTQHWCKTDVSIKLLHFMLRLLQIISD